jgi:hypothetical protein
MKNKKVNEFAKKSVSCNDYISVRTKANKEEKTWDFLMM